MREDSCNQIKAIELRSNLYLTPKGTSVLFLGMKDFVIKTQSFALRRQVQETYSNQQIRRSAFAELKL